MEERKITASDVVTLLWDRFTVDRQPQDEGRTLYRRGDIAIIVHEQNKTVVTVLLADEDRDSWEDAAAERAETDLGISLSALIAIADEVAPLPRVPFGTRTPRRRTAAPVQVSNIYDTLPGHMLATARTLLRAHGLDPTDMRRVKLVGKRLEIDLSPNR
jgi:hypothetical protein